MQPKSIGIREAKIQLSKLLKLVQKGNEVILTDHGRPVGKIVPIQPETLALSDRIQRLEDQGVMEPGRENVPAKIPRPIPILDEMAQRFLREDKEGSE